MLDFAVRAQEMDAQYHEKEIWKKETWERVVRPGSDV